MRDMYRCFGVADGIFSRLSSIGRILLANLFPPSQANISAQAFPWSCALHGAIRKARFSTLPSSPTVAHEVAITTADEKSFAIFSRESLLGLGQHQRFWAGLDNSPPGSVLTRFAHTRLKRRLGSDIWAVVPGVPRIHPADGGMTPQNQTLSLGTASSGKGGDVTENLQAFKHNTGLASRLFHTLVGRRIQDISQAIPQEVEP
jgi:hypothetical protein